MRFILSILIWVVFVGGLWLYTWHRNAALPKSPSTVQAVERVKGDFSLEVTPTFSIEKDPFALQSDTKTSSSLELRLNGRILEVAAEDLTRGKVIKIHDLSDLQVGFNEIYIKASPPLAETQLAHGLRVNLLDQGLTIVDQTVWGSGGGLVSGSISFTFTPSKDEDHDH